MVAIPKKVSARLSKEVGAFQRVLKAAKDRDVNESDTVTITADILSEVFGYDRYLEITSEQEIRGTFCDLAIKVGDKTEFLIEVKAIGLSLKNNHVRQAINYGANAGIRWVILTNGIEWRLYRIKFEGKLDFECICTFDFLELNPRIEEDRDLLFILCKEGISKAAIQEFHEHVQCVNRFVIGAMATSDPVLNVIRRELKRMSPGVKVSPDEIKGILLDDVLKRDVVDSDAAKEATARIKKAKTSSLRKRKTKKNTDAATKP